MDFASAVQDFVCRPPYSSRYLSGGPSVPDFLSLGTSPFLVEYRHTHRTQKSQSNGLLPISLSQVCFTSEYYIREKPECRN